MQSVFHGAKERGYAKHGWLTTHHSFSFASYYDPEKMGFGALRVINDDEIAPGAGFGEHPHDNMEIITIPLTGALKHEDSMGNAAVVTAGEVQVMSAGTGVFHAEYNASSTDPLTLFQIWILTHVRNVAPRYDQKRFDPEKFRNTFFQVVGNMGTEGGLGIYQDARIFLSRLDPGKKLEYTLKSEKHGVYFLVIEGKGVVGGKTLSQRDALGVWETEKVEVEALEEAVFLLAIEVPLREE
jgi:redox-sensitive bicupin YhaK (pirin superfamily)